MPKARDPQPFAEYTNFENLYIFPKIYKYLTHLHMGVGAYRDGGDASPPRGERGVLWTKGSKGKRRRRHGVEKLCLAKHMDEIRRCLIALVTVSFI